MISSQKSLFLHKFNNKKKAPPIQENRELGYCENSSDLMFCLNHQQIEGLEIEKIAVHNRFPLKI